MNPGKLPLSQGNLPPSTITPPMEVPCPPMNLVAEWTTMSAPWASGLTRYGDGRVLSMIRGIPASWATAATASMSRVFRDGLPTVSVKIALVLSVMAARKFSGSRSSTNLTFIPILGSV